MRAVEDEEVEHQQVDPVRPRHLAPTSGEADAREHSGAAEELEDHEDGQRERQEGAA